MEGAAGILVAVVAMLALGLAAAALVLGFRQARQSPEWSSPSARTTGLERRLVQVGQRLEVLEREIDAQRDLTGGAPSPLSTVRTAGVAVSHLGLVRFDAFEDAGGAQSFALALIDDDGDGVVLTSLHSRQATRLYIKAVRRGVADAPLSAEEIRAMQDAGIAPTV